MADATYIKYKKAREYFCLKPGDGLVLHHKDPTLKYTNPERYDEWRPEDLIVMTKAEHNRLHHKGKKNGPMSEEHKKRIGEANRGKKRSEETIKKISETRKRPVAQCALAGQLVRVWESAKAAEVEGGFDGGSIGKVCKGKLKSHKNYIWRYANNNTEK